MFQFGQKVVCLVEASSWLVLNGETPPRKGGIYHIREICELGAGVRLREIVNTPRHYEDRFIECSFNASAFRPVIERETDISEFINLQNPTPQQRRESIGIDLGFTLEEIGVE